MECIATYSREYLTTRNGGIDIISVFYYKKDNDEHICCIVWLYVNLFYMQSMTQVVTNKSFHLTFLITSVIIKFKMKQKVRLKKALYYINLLGKRHFILYNYYCDKKMTGSRTSRFQEDVKVLFIQHGHKCMATNVTFYSMRKTNDLTQVVVDSICFRKIITY